MIKLDKLKGTIDFGIITIRRDEYEAVLERFEGDDNIEGERNYRISDVITEEEGKIIRIAIVRSNGRGEGEAQSAAHDMITELDPKCLLAVGIAGGIPDNDFSLGDVVVATHIHDFSVEAVLEKGNEYDVKGLTIPKVVQNLIVSLKSHEKKLGSWVKDTYLPEKMPMVEYANLDRYYGPDDWKKKVFKSLEMHFKASNHHHTPKVIDGPVASSDRLIKNAEITQKLLSFIRSTRAVEMEVAGVYRATQGTKKNHLLTTIRGISDIIGFERDDDWTNYACQSAAAFTYAFVKSGLLIPPTNVKEIRNLIISPNIVDNNIQGELEIIRQKMLTIIDMLDKIKGLLGGYYVTVGNCDDAVECIRRIKEELTNILRIINTRNDTPKILLSFRDSFLVEFGVERDGGLNSLLKNIQHLRGVLQTAAADTKRSEIQAGIWEITRNSKTLITRHLSQ